VDGLEAAEAVGVAAGVVAGVVAGVAAPVVVPGVEVDPELVAGAASTTDIWKVTGKGHPPLL